MCRKTFSTHVTNALWLEITHSTGKLMKFSLMTKDFNHLWRNNSKFLFVLQLDRSTHHGQQRGEFFQPWHSCVHFERELYKDKILTNGTALNGTWTKKCHKVAIEQITQVSLKFIRVSWKAVWVQILFSLHMSWLIWIYSGHKNLRVVSPFGGSLKHKILFLYCSAVFTLIKCCLWSRSIQFAKVHFVGHMAYIG